MTELDKMVVKYDDMSAAIAKMTKEYMRLTISDAKDTKGFEIVHRARMDVKSKRVTIQKQEQAFKDVLNKKKREVVGQAQEIYEQLEPIETYLDKIESVYTAEKKRIADEKKAKEKERVDGIQAKIGSIRSAVHHLSSSLTSHQIKDLHTSVKILEIAKSVFQEFEAEAETAKTETLTVLATAYNERKVQEQADEERRVEDARLAEERKVLAAQAQALEEKARKVQEAEEALEAKAEATPETVETEKEALEKMTPGEVVDAEFDPIQADKEKLEGFAYSIIRAINRAETTMKLSDEKAIIIFKDTLDGIENIMETFKSDIENL